MTFSRRNFLKASSLGILPAAIPFSSVLAADPTNTKRTPAPAPVVRFFGDGEIFAPADYLDQLQKAHSVSPLLRDSYGRGGEVEKLEKKFAEITGKEKAIFMPTGTMANQLAIAVLSGENTKVFVQDTSHVYRDEADAAQSVFGKRLMPLGKGETFFTADELKNAIDNMPKEEVFQSGIGAVSIENPVRRTDGRFVPLEEIKKISAHCRNNNIKLHLDGARIYMTAAWTGIPVKEWASYFDTIYISLYKYLGASGGAILCGSKEVIDKMPHLVKIHGGNMFGNWLNAAMALHRLDGLEARLQEALKRAAELFPLLNQLRGIKISALQGGTNIYELDLAKEMDGNKIRERLVKEYSVIIPPFDKNNHTTLTVNESLLNQDLNYIINAFTKTISAP